MAGENQSFNIHTNLISNCHIAEAFVFEYIFFVEC
jgi:hypothetical protein